MNKLVKYLKHYSNTLSDKILSSRTITTLILLLLCNFVFAIPVLKFTGNVGYQANVTMLPFFLYDLGYSCTFLAIIIYYFSEVPFLKHSEMYCIIREGKTRWIGKQLIHIVVMSFVFMAMVIVTSIIPFLLNGDFSNEWNEVSMTLSVTDKWQEYNTVICSGDILQKYAPWESMIAIFFYVSLLVCFMGIFLFTISLCINRLIAICAGMFFEIMIITEYNTRMLDMYLIYVSPFSWLNLSIFGRKFNGFEYPNGTPTMAWCIMALLIVIAVMIVIDMIRIHHMNFNFSYED